MDQLFGRILFQHLVERRPASTFLQLQFGQLQLQLQLQLRLQLQLQLQLQFNCNYIYNLSPSVFLTLQRLVLSLDKIYEVRPHIFFYE